MSANEHQAGEALADDELTATQLNSLARAEALESAIAPPVDENGNPVQPAPEPMDAGQENTIILGLLIDMLKPAMPFLNGCYPPATVQRIALAYTAVEEKRGWNARAFLSVEAQLAIVAIPPAIQAFVMGREYFKRLMVEKRTPWWLRWMLPGAKKAGKAEAGEGAE